MRRFAFFVFLFVSIFSLFFFFTSSAFANSEFTTDYSVSYTISANSNTRVNFKVTLTNTSDQYYASSYKILVGFKDIKNLAASDPDGSIKPDVVENVKGEEIGLTFNKKVVGLGNKLIFNLSFDTNEVAQNFGKVWEINIPGLSNQNDFESFNVNVLYPSAFGKATFIKPFVPGAQSENSLNFTKNDLGSSGISIAFGEYQIYSFDLSYHLENRNLFPVTTEIALPPNTNYQDVLIDNLTPKPTNVKIDSDGNWLAQYNLYPSQKININAKGRAKVFLYPRADISPSLKSSSYLKQEPYWQQTDEIKILALKLKTPRNIYDYVVKNLSYDFSRVTEEKARLGAVGVLSNPSSAVCLEFTDLFVALSRAAGIPAREVDGFANTKNTQERPLSLVKDILHAWPEYYDSERKMWIMVDPTWGNTTGGVDYFNTIDFDHLAFVIKGENSSYPVPAGGYKLSKNDYSKDVNVSFGNDFTTIYSFGIKTNFPKDILSFLPLSGNIRISNLGNTISKPQEIGVESYVLSPKKKTISISAIPPFGFIDIPVAYDRLPILTKTTDTIRISSKEGVYYQVVNIAPFFINREILGGLIAIFVIIISITAFIYWRIRISKLQK